MEEHSCCCCGGTEKTTMRTDEEKRKLLNRLKRIEALTGLDWGDGDLMFRLYFALCIMRYERLVHNMGG